MKNKIMFGLAAVLLIAASGLIVAAEEQANKAAALEIVPQAEVMPLTGCFIYAKVSIGGYAYAKADSAHLKPKYSNGKDQDSCWLKLEGPHKFVHKYGVICSGIGYESAYARAESDNLYTGAKANTHCTCKVYKRPLQEPAAELELADLPKDVKVTSFA